MIVEWLQGIHRMIITNEVRACTILTLLVVCGHPQSPNNCSTDGLPSSDPWSNFEMFLNLQCQPRRIKPVCVVTSGDGRSACPAGVKPGELPVKVRPLHYSLETAGNNMIRFWPILLAELCGPGSNG